MNTSVIILSAGQGKRMGTSLPKALHPVGGKPILSRLLEAVKKLEAADIYVVIRNEHSKLLTPLIRSFQAQSIIQPSNISGTGAAIKSLPFEKLQNHTLIINGDHPLITSNDLKVFLSNSSQSESDLSIGTCSISNPKNMGRIIREGSQVKKIVEYFDFNEEIQAINEVNTGLIHVKSQILSDNIRLITNDNPNNEYLITDLVSLCFDQGLKTLPIDIPVHGAFGVNTQEELALANAYVFEKKVQNLMDHGVIFPDPHSLHIEDDVFIGHGSIIYPGVYLKGKTHIGSFCAVEQNCHIYDSQISDSVLIKAYSYIEKTLIKSKSIIGPYARLRPGTIIGSECKIGNFTEIKNTQIGNKSQSSHFSYLGDSIIGSEVNIGCGTVTCNYTPDKKKFKTHIGDKAFIGSGSMLLAPITIGENSIIGAGSVINKDVPKDTLAIARSEQQNKKRKKENKK